MPNVLPFFKECKQYNISLWQCPSFLFFILGLFNIIAIISTYFISNYFTDEPEVTALLTITVSLIIFIIGSTIVRGFDRLLEANKMKTEFIRIASHQLRTPLASLRWSVDLLSGGLGKPKEEQKEYLDIIKESNLRMIKLINDLLDVTKIEMGGFKMKLGPVDLGKIVEEVVKELSLLAKANNISLKVDLKKNLPLVLSDPDKMKMVFSNLIDNAIKYTKGGGKIFVKLDKNGEFLRAEIKDEGVGIPKADQKNIFQKFFRSDNVMKHQTIGSGLGLFIVKSIVDANKGKIWFQSQENKGTTFYCKIPIARSG